MYAKDLRAFVVLKKFNRDKEKSETNQRKRRKTNVVQQRLVLRFDVIYYIQQIKLIYF